DESAETGFATGVDVSDLFSAVSVLNGCVVAATGGVRWVSALAVPVAADSTGARSGGVFGVAAGGTTVGAAASMLPVSFFATGAGFTWFSATSLTGVCAGGSGGAFPAGALVEVCAACFF